MKKLVKGMATFWLFSFSVAAEDAKYVTGKVSKISDLDTIVVGQGENAVRVRLIGIDGPELNQSCENGGRVFACGEEWTLAMLGPIYNKDVVCRWVKKDRFGRVLADCATNEIKSISEFLLERGWAVLYVPDHPKNFIEIEKAAIERKAGVWGGFFVEPWIYRKFPKCQVLSLAKVDQDCWSDRQKNRS